MLHEDGAHCHAVVVLGVDDDRLHVGGRGLLARAASARDAEVDVGHVAVASDADLVHAHRLRDVDAALVEHPEVHVVGEGAEHVVEGGAGARRGLVGVDERRDGIGREPRDRETRRGGAEDVDGVRRPAADEEVGQIHDVVGVQVGEEDRLAPAAGRRSKMGFSPRPARHIWRCAPSPQSTR